MKIRIILNDSGEIIALRGCCRATDFRSGGVRAALQDLEEVEQ